MLVAAIDTSTPTLSLALCEAEGPALRVLAETAESAREGGHGARLPAALLELLAGRGLAPADVGAWVCGLGPGSFTGLRIGLATWKGFAYALRRPLVGGSSLGALAVEAAPLAAPGALLVPLLDAKKGEVYAGFYARATDGGVALAAPEAALAPGSVVERLAGVPHAVAFGHGRDAYAAALEGVPALVGAPSTPSARSLARLCLPALADARYDAARVFALEPHYVRPSEAELKFPHGHGPGAR